MQVRLNTAPHVVIRRVRPLHRSSGVPISASSRARARSAELRDRLGSLTSVTVVPSDAC